MISNPKNTKSPRTTISYNDLIFCSPCSAMVMQNTMCQAAARGPRGGADKVICNRSESWTTDPTQALSMLGIMMCAMHCRQNIPPLSTYSIVPREEAANRRGQSPKKVGIVTEVFVSGISADRPQVSLTKKQAIWYDNATPWHAVAAPTNATISKLFPKSSMAEAEADDKRSSAPYS